MLQRNKSDKIFWFIGDFPPLLTGLLPGASYSGLRPAGKKKGGNKKTFRVLERLCQLKNV